MCALDCGTITFMKKIELLDSLMEKRLSFFHSKIVGSSPVAFFSSVVVIC